MNFKKCFQIVFSPTLEKSTQSSHQRFRRAQNFVEASLGGPQEQNGSLLLILVSLAEHEQ